MSDPKNPTFDPENPTHQKVRERMEAAAAANSPQGMRQAAIEKETTQFRAEALRKFPGTAEEFEAAWPSILQGWQTEKTLQATKKTIKPTPL